MLKASKNLDLELINYGPRTEEYSPGWIVSASGLLTAESGSLFDVLENTSEGEVRALHRESTKRGHASLLTTPLFWLWVEGSRMIDFYGSAWPFGSYIIFSSRRIKITPDIAVIPDSIKEDEKASEIYKKAVNEMMGIYHELLENYSIDEARRTLPLGFSSYGLMSWPVQLIFGMVREAKRQEEWMPSELRRMAKRAMGIVKNNIPSMAKGIEEMPYDTTYPHSRNLFREPEDIPMSGSDILLNELELPEYGGGLALEEWKKLAKRGKSRFIAKLEMDLSIAAWNDIKRQRTVDHEVEPLYSAAEREDMHLPPNIGSNEEALRKYKEAFSIGIEAYNRLKEQIPVSEAIYILPHSLKVHIRQILNGYHFFGPFGLYGVRACTQTDYEVREKINEELKKLGNRRLTKLAGPKCKMKFCPERNFCKKIFKYRPDYDREAHRKGPESLTSDSSSHT